MTKLTSNGALANASLATGNGKHFLDMGQRPLLYWPASAWHMGRLHRLPWEALRGSERNMQRRAKVLTRGFSCLTNGDEEKLRRMDHCRTAVLSYKINIAIGKAWGT